MPYYLVLQEPGVGVRVRVRVSLLHARTEDVLAVEHPNPNPNPDPDPNPDPNQACMRGPKTYSPSRRRDRRKTITGCCRKAMHAESAKSTAFRYRKTCGWEHVMLLRRGGSTRLGLGLG